MSNLIETAKENFSKLPMWAWGAIAGGFVLIAYLGSKRTSLAPAPTYSSSGVLENNKVSESEVAHRIGQVVQDLQGSFGEKFQEQSSDFMKILGERDQAHADMIHQSNATWADRLGTLTNSIFETNSHIQNQLNDLTKAPATTPLDVTSNAGSLRTGTYSSLADAERTAKALAQSYGGQNTQIVNEGGRYRVVSSFEDTARAGAVLDRLQERNLTQIGKVS